jgi:hypothetical protein
MWRQFLLLFWRMWIELEDTACEEIWIAMLKASHWWHGRSALGQRKREA